MFAVLSRPRKLIARVSVLFSMFWLAACDPIAMNGSASTGGPSIDPGAPVAVALLVPWGGGNAGDDALSDSLEKAARLAVSDLEGVKIDLRVYGTGGNPARAQESALQAVADGAKIILANEVTTLAHGRAAAEAAEATAREVFEKGGIGDDLPTLTLSADEVGEGISIVQVLVRSGLAASGKEAKRLIADHGARSNDEPLTDAGLMLSVVDLGAPVKLSAGKKRHALVQLG